MDDAGAATYLLGAIVALGGGVAGALVGRRRQAALPQGPSAEVEVERLRAEAVLERDAGIKHAEISAREEALALRAAADAELRVQEERQVRVTAALVGRSTDLEARRRETAEARERLRTREAPLEALAAERKQHEKAAREAAAGVRGLLEKVSGTGAEVLRRGLVELEIEGARAAGAQLVRQAGEMTADPEVGRRAKRLMGIAVGRFEGHYLTERHHSVVALPPPRNGKAIVGELEIGVIERVAGIKLTLLETGDAVKLEGLDGVGREVARRSLARLMKRGSGNEAAVTRLVKEVALEIDREVVELGRRAFSVLQIDRAHPEIVKLVGRLNWRTSYTQNQWKHAVEASFLCGMMAEEMGMDRKVARRAALMHDIGKALTHEMDGSHAVIGADYARRLGETEVVANAIGAHHTEEPFSTPYAYLVAASDAMSGARPGARRQQEDNHMAKIADLERLSRGFPGVAEAYAVQGGREVRVMVNEAAVDDLRAVELSSEIASLISREMTFPGQIRITVIRELRAVERAGG